MATLITAKMKCAVDIGINVFHSKIELASNLDVFIKNIKKRKRNCAPIFNNGGRGAKAVKFSQVHKHIKNYFLVPY